MVLPAPLGPISATSSRGFTVSEKSETAVRPPKRMVARRTSISAAESSGALARGATRLSRRQGNRSQTSRVPSRPRGLTSMSTTSAIE